MIRLDEWQRRVLETKGNIVLRSGRQVGKSTVISVKASDFACLSRNKSVLIIAAVERQAQLMLVKVLDYLSSIPKYKRMIKGGRDRPTMSRIKLTNGSIIQCLPTGLSGLGIRGFTIDLLIADEAAFIPEDVWAAVTPMLLTTGGDTILLSTPYGRKGYFYDCFDDEGFTSYHVSSEEVINNRPISQSWTEFQREKALAYLKREKDKMSKVQYAQEYLGEFVDDLQRWFSDEWIEKVCLLVPEENNGAGVNNYLGMDVAGMGGDETVLLSLSRSEKETLRMFGLEISVKERLPVQVKRVLAADKRVGYKKIYIDDGGLGSGVFEPLLFEDQTKRKVVAINNASKALDRDERRKRKLLKEDLYINVLRLGEKDKLLLWSSPEIQLSLRSIQYEYITDGRGNKTLKIFGRYTHIVEALIRAAWCVRDKSLSLWIRSSKYG